MTLARPRRPQVRCFAIISLHLLIFGQIFFKLWFFFSIWDIPSFGHALLSSCIERVTDFLGIANVAGNKGAVGISFMHALAHNLIPFIC
jgi:hypothetical protein